MCDDLRAAVTVLVVDDHPSFRRFARELLEADGFVVVAEAADGASAVAAAQALRPDVVLLDVLLPDTSGFEVAERLRSDSSDTVVVLTSSRSADDFGDAPARSGARAFIAKADLTATAVAELVEGAV